MIVKIWPIKSGNTGNAKGLTNSFEYVSNPEKCILNRNKDR